MKKRKSVPHMPRSWDLLLIQFYVGNSDRRVAKPVKEYAQKTSLHGRMDIRIQVTCRSHGGRGFYGSEKSVIVEEETSVEIRFKDGSGDVNL